jgi:superfamily II DNA/RNA helicase
MTEPELLETNGDFGEPILECLYQRASDSTTISLHVRTDFGWLLVLRPTEALATQIQLALSTGAEALAYRVDSEVGIIIRVFRKSA